ncbi:MAG: YggS family pyridoxal phosphate-dependent enzyme [Planctomycetes bacterium]|nr:YggS family pyridoxal phosphate-dependent enzyme [Planctomycetota bacterium]
MGQTADNYRRIRESLPPEVSLVVAAKGRRLEELRDVVRAGARLLGENYVQEAERHYSELGDVARQVQWHLIGHLQRNKVSRALSLFDRFQSVDSARLARAISERAVKPVPVLIEINIAGESSKHGIPPEAAQELVALAGGLANLRVEGLMTMEPYMEDPEGARPYFRRMRRLFEEIKAADVENVEMKTLSMGMSNSYRVAIEEGANMVRVGTAIFGPR